MARPNTLRDCLTVFGVTLFAVAALGCADDTTASGGAGAGGGASAGGGDEGGASQGGGAEGGQGAGDPVIPGEHPRIYLNDAERARLSTALAAPTAAADRYKAYVDAALEGNTPYDFQGWHAALVYALTGDDAYADLAIAHVDAMVAEDEALVAAGSSPLVAADSYLEGGAARRGHGHGLRLVLRPSDRRAADALDRLGQPGRVQRLASRRGELERAAHAVERLGRR